MLMERAGNSRARTRQHPAIDQSGARPCLGLLAQLARSFADSPSIGCFSKNFELVRSKHADIMLPFSQLVTLDTEDRATRMYVVHWMTPVWNSELFRIKPKTSNA